MRRAIGGSHRHRPSLGAAQQRHVRSSLPMPVSISTPSLPPRPSPSSSLGPSSSFSSDCALRGVRLRASIERGDQTRGGGARAQNRSSSAAPPNNRRPRLRALVVVEGPSDARAVLRAVDLSSGCHSLGGATWARNKAAMAELVQVAERAGFSKTLGKPAAAVVLLCLVSGCLIDCLIDLMD